MNFEADDRDFQREFHCPNPRWELQRWINRRADDDRADIVKEVSHYLKETRRFQCIDDHLFRTVQISRVLLQDLGQEISEEVVREIAEEAVQDPSLFPCSVSPAGSPLAEALAEEEADAPTTGAEDDRRWQ